MRGFCSTFKIVCTIACYLLGQRVEGNNTACETWQTPGLLIAISSCFGYFNWKLYEFLFLSHELLISCEKGDNILLFLLSGEIRDPAVIYCGIIRPGFIRKLILINGSINWGQVKSPLYQPQPGSRYQSLLPPRSQIQGRWRLDNVA